MTTELVVTAIARSRRQVATDLLSLTKPRVVVMILVTTLVGYYVGVSGTPDYVRMLHLVVGTLLAAGGTLALNQYWERDVDARMERTRARPLPDGRLSPLEALVFGGAITVLGVGYLAAFVNGLAALVTAATVILYLFAYTPLKLRTALCTVVGAVPGALPPVTGWVAAREDFSVGAWVLFGILFLWQLPHTLAIARLYRDDYARAGVRVLPVIDPHGTSAERQIVTGCLALLGVSLLPTLTGLAGGVYFAGALALGLAFVALGGWQASGGDGMTPVVHAPPRPPSERRTNGRIPPAPPDFGGDGDDDREHGPRRGLDNLRLAVLFFMGAEAMFFGALISALLVLRLGMAAWPPPLEPRLPIAVTGLNTLVLLASSVTLVTAGPARRPGGPPRHPRRALGAAALRARFLAPRGAEWGPPSG